jgi:hypothetical protein
VVQLTNKACLLHVVEEATKAWVSSNPILFSSQENKYLGWEFLLDVGRVTNFPEHTQFVVVLRRAMPSRLGALALRVTNATRRLECEPNALGVRAHFGKLSCQFWRPISQGITRNQWREVGSLQWLERSLSDGCWEWMNELAIGRRKKRYKCPLPPNWPLSHDSAAYCAVVSWCDSAA